MKARTTLRPLTSFLAVLVFTGGSLATASAAEDTDIEDAIQNGVALRKDGNDEAALGLFLELERKNPESVRILLQITAAAQASGRWVLAHHYLRKAATFRNDPYYLRNRGAVKNMEDAVAQHVGQFRVLGEPAGAEVRLSGNLIGTLPLRDPVPVQLGSYTLEVTKPGFYQLRREVVVSNGGALSQELVELKPNRRAQLPALGALSQSAGSSGAPTSPDQGPDFWGSRSLTWVLGGAALTAAATSGIAWWIREDNAGRWNDEEQCLDRQQSTRTRQELCGNDKSQADTAQTVAISAATASAVLAAATITHLLATPKKSERARANHVSAECGVGVGSIACSGKF